MGLLRWAACTTRTGLAAVPDNRSVPAKASRVSQGGKGWSGRRSLGLTCQRPCQSSWGPSRPASRSQEEPNRSWIWSTRNWPPWDFPPCQWARREASPLSFCDCHCHCQGVG
jgi:hypothetical protein